MKKQIGWYNLPKEEVFTNTYECAAWYERVLVPAGRYPVEVYDYTERKDGSIDGHVSSVYVSMEGTVESDYFQSLFCGVPVGGPYDCSKNKGNKSSTSLCLYMFMVAESVATDENTRWELFPEYEVRGEEFDRLCGEGKLTLYRIYKKQEG